MVSFKRISLKPNEKEIVTFKITDECLVSTDNDGREIILDGCYKFTITDGCDFSRQPIIYYK